MVNLFPLSRLWLCLYVHAFLKYFLFLIELLPSSLMELRSACTSRSRSRSFHRCYSFEITFALSSSACAAAPGLHQMHFTLGVCVALPPGARLLALSRRLLLGHPRGVTCRMGKFSRQSAQATQATPHLSYLQSQCQNLKHRPFLPYLNHATQLGPKRRRRHRSRHFTFLKKIQ